MSQKPKKTVVPCRTETWTKDSKEFSADSSSRNKASQYVVTHQDSSTDSSCPLRYSVTRSVRPPDSQLARLLFHPQFETMGGFVVLSNFVIMTLETHATATDDGNVLNFVSVANRVFLLYYTAEFVLRLCVLRRTFFQHGWNNLDLFIVSVGWIGELLEILEVTGGMSQIAMLKSLRMLRLLRLLRLFVAFRELYVLVAGIGRCMKTLFWASGLIFMVLNVWAILSVEFLDERVQELVPTGVYKTCSWCSYAFSNIWNANVTWFQIISTQDWTLIGRPLAEEFTWPYAFFVFNVFVVIWGLLNLIVAAIVDANIAAREEDVAITAQIADQVYIEAWNIFEQICKDMDVDGSGDVSLKEFKAYLQNNVELQQHLLTMGINERDINDLLNIMDEDGSGSLETEEFIEQFTAMRTLVEKTSLYFVLRYCESMQRKLLHLSQLVSSLRSDMASVMNPCAGASLKHSANDLLDSTYLKNSSDSIQSPAATPRSGQAGNRGSVEELAAPQGVLRNTAQTYRTSVQPEMPCPDLKMLPPGWYYIGASMPSESSVWCKTEDVNGHAMRAGNFRAMRIDLDDTKEVLVTADGQRWEPLKSNTIHVHYAKHVYVRAPIGDVQLPSEIVQALAAVDKFMDGIYSESDPKEAPLTMDGQRWEALLTNSIRIQHAKHVYVRAPIGDVQLPPQIVDALVSVDRFIDSICSEPSAAANKAVSLQIDCKSLDLQKTV